MPESVDAKSVELSPALALPDVLTSAGMALLRDDPAMFDRIVEEGRKS
jgi:hypothetical protein